MQGGWRIAPAKVKIPPPESISWWWHPSRPGVRLAPSWFRERLPEGIDVTWDAYREKWNVFARAPKVQHRWCQGWKLLFVAAPQDLQISDGDYILARIEAMDMLKQGGSMAHYHRVAREVEREAELSDRRQKDDTMQQALESFTHSQIKVSMRGHSSGSKFSDYHA